MTLGSWLKQYREQQQIGQPELADSIGIEQSYLSKLENDKSLPSSEILDNIINATQTTLDKLVEGLDKSYVYNQLSKLPQVKAFLVNQKQQDNQQSSRRLFLFGLLLSLGCFVFFLGYGQVISTNIHYQYHSGGILAEGEPLKTFDTDRRKSGLLNNDEYQRRFNPKTVIMDDKKMPAFVSNSKGERRYFVVGRRIYDESGFNRMLKALGVLLFSGGFFGVVLLLLGRKVLNRG
ncbi:MAG: helix-turn-helix transcriptional regulator [Algicola sp.]|nr:helix-turn-helix transcriptional regulator [Algicola sp.]